MYRCDKCICIKCKNYFGNNGDCEQCLVCGISIATPDKTLFNECDDFEPYENKFSQKQNLEKIRLVLKIQKKLSQCTMKINF